MSACTSFSHLVFFSPFSPQAARVQAVEFNTSRGHCHSDSHQRRLICNSHGQVVGVRGETSAGEGLQDNMTKRNLRVVTYNLLSSSLASPGYFTHCKASDLDAENRLSKIKVKLKTEMDSGAIICLQEVSLSWAGTLAAFFQKQGYTFQQSQYGNYFSNFMGVGIGFPSARYTLENCEMMQLSGSVKWKKKYREQRSLNPLRWIASIPRVALSAVGFVPSSRKNQDWLETVKFKPNRIVMLELKCLHSKRNFNVGTYHMPCMPGQNKIMLTHAVLAAQFMEDRAGTMPYLLAGDWNILPGSEPYTHLTEGKSDVTLDLPEGEKWTPELKKPLKSAYRDFLGSEPEFTNNAQVRDQPPFVGTLDYIFTSKEWNTLDILALPEKSSIKGPFPDKNQPSDHLMLRATFEEVPKHSSF